MRTTADEHLDNAKEHLRAAIADLSRIVVEQCDGHDDYREAYRLKLKRLFNKLIDMRDDLES